MANEINFSSKSLEEQIAVRGIGIGLDINLRQVRLRQSLAKQEMYQEPTVSVPE